MARALRLQFENALYHVCARGNRRDRIFINATDYSRFEQFLAQSLRRYQVELHAYVLLPNHFHLLAQTANPNLSRWMHWLVTSYSIWFNRKHGLNGHLFQGRYKSFLVGSGSYLLELSRYLHLNPVRGRVVGAGKPDERRQRLRSYTWSSYRGYAGLAKPKEFITEELVMGDFGGQRCDQKLRVRYRQFVEEGLLREIENPFEQVKWQSALGTESFSRRMIDKLKSRRDQRHEVTGVRRALREADPERLIQRVAHYYKMPPSELVRERRYGSEARNLAIWVLRQKGALTLREIGSLFGGIDYAAVSQRVRRMDRAISQRKDLSKICKMLNV